MEGVANHVIHRGVNIVPMERTLAVRLVLKFILVGSKETTWSYMYVLHGVLITQCVAFEK